VATEIDVIIRSLCGARESHLKASVRTVVVPAGVRTGTSE
jgi:hypothetical protein